MRYAWITVKKKCNCMRLIIIFLCFAVKKSILQLKSIQLSSKKSLLLKKKLGLQRASTQNSNFIGSMFGVTRMTYVGISQVSRLLQSLILMIVGILHLVSCHQNAYAFLFQIPLRKSFLQSAYSPFLISFSRYSIVALFKRSTQDKNLGQERREGLGRDETLIFLSRPNPWITSSLNRCHVVL